MFPVDFSSARLRKTELSLGIAILDGDVLSVKVAELG